MIRRVSTHHDANWLFISEDGDQLGEMQTDAWQALKEKNIEVN